MKVYAEVEIEGVKPLLINTFPIETLSRDKSRSGTTGKDESEWERTVLMNHERELFVHTTYLVGAITAAGKLIKVGKATLSKKVGSSLEVVETSLPIKGRYVPLAQDITNNSSDAVYLDVRAVVNPMTKGRNVRYRVATKPGWRITATLSWDDKAVSKDDMKICVENAGLFEGIGDGRKIGFGRFKMLSFKMKQMD